MEEKVEEIEKAQRFLEDVGADNGNDYNGNDVNENDDIGADNGNDDNGDIMSSAFRSASSFRDR